MNFRVPNTLAVVLAAALLSVAYAAPARRSGGRGDLHVVLVTIDGFSANELDNPQLPIPNIRQLEAEGARADRMQVVTPSVTWPNHTTLVTGMTPAHHGVLANGKIEQVSGGERPYVVNLQRSRADMCRAPALFNLAADAKLLAAGINWPVTRSEAALMWSMPECPEQLRYTTPDLMRDLLQQKILPANNDAGFKALKLAMQDHVWAQATAYIIKQHRPHLTLLHLLNTDITQHRHGPGTEETIASIALADRELGDVLQAVRDAGIGARTAVFVTSDHGFLPYTREIRPNVRLKAAGLIHEDSSGQGLRFDAQSIAEGGVAMVYVPDGQIRPPLIERTRKALEGLEGVEQIVMPDSYEALGLPAVGKDPQAPSLLLVAKRGYSFNNLLSGGETATLPSPHGAHGYPASNPDMDGIFVAAGAGIKKGVRLKKIRNLDVAPTIAQLLGLEMTGVDGKAIAEILEVGG